MHFQIFTIERYSATEVILYGKPTAESYLPITSIIVKDVLSPVYFLPVAGCAEQLISDIKKYTTFLKNIEEVERTNIFFNGFPRTLTLLKASFSAFVSFSDFETDYCDLLLTEFTNPVENIIIGKRLRGPCLVELPDVHTSPNSRAVPSVSYNDISFLRNSKFGVLKKCAIATETSKNTIKSFSIACEDLTCSGSVQNENSISQSPDLENHLVFKTSKELALYLSNLIRKTEPDVVVLHGCHVRGKIELKGKIVCDLFDFASSQMHCKDYSVQELASNYEIKVGEGLSGKAAAMLKVFDKMGALNLGKELAETSGCLLNRCLEGARMERTEYTLLHELYARKYLFPQNTVKTDQKYTGGLVLDPINGFYDNFVLLLDFNSLYPSIIQEFNICFSEYHDPGTGGAEENKKHQNNFKTFLPSIFKNLVNRRRTVKDSIKHCTKTEDKEILDIRQKALKLTANSIYGCLGSPLSRFCNFEMAAAITAYGRALLHETRQFALELGLKVIYGDTDSLMIHTNLPGEPQYYKDAIESVKNLVSKINSKYSIIEIEFEKAFSRLLLYSKKKYAARVCNQSSSYIETKGLDIGRRDFSEASGIFLQKILHIILDDQKDAADLLYNECSHFYSTIHDLPPKSFLIHTLLSKNPAEYSAAVDLPHVHLAKRLEKDRGISFRRDDVVSYLIIESNAPLAERAIHFDELNNFDQLNYKIDYKYYIKREIVPSLVRLFKYWNKADHSRLLSIFGADNSVRPSQSSLCFTSECCGSLLNASKRCLKCSKELSDISAILQADKMLKEQCEALYGTGAECASCKISYFNGLKSCIYCGCSLHTNYDPAAFDEFLSSLDAAGKRLGISSLSKMAQKYIEISAYSTINMSKLYPAETARYKNENRNKWHYEN